MSTIFLLAPSPSGLGSIKCDGRKEIQVTCCSLFSPPQVDFTRSQTGHGI